MKHVLRNHFANIVTRLLRVNDCQRLSVLIYHRVLAEPDYMRSNEPTVEQFHWQMELISRHFVPLSMKKALHLMDVGKLPDRAVCVTFDDGYADNMLLALPVLKKWRVPATVFVSTSFLNGGIMWNDVILETFRSTTREHVDLTELGLGCYVLDSEGARCAAAYNVLELAKYLEPELRGRIVQRVSEFAEHIPMDLMLTSEQVQQLHERGIEIGAHTVTHPILDSVDSQTASGEIEMSKKYLEDITHNAVRYFAYPNGTPHKDYKREHVAMVQDLGFEAAFSTGWGVSGLATDRFQLPRFTPWDNSPDRFLTRLLLNQRLLVENEGVGAGRPA